MSAPAAARSNQSDEERDFVPGERVIFYDDFTDMAKGAAPPHWKVRGGVARLSPDGRLQLRDAGTMYANLKTLPKNYTVEMEIQPEYADGTRYVNWMFTDAADESVWAIGYQFDVGEITVSLMTGHGHSDYEGHPRSSIKVEYGKPIRLALWYQDTRICAYVKEIAAALQKQAALKVRIEGHTDSTGDAAKNLDLSKRRAESVKAALVELGIDAARLVTEGFGQTKPLSTNDTPQGRAENRRVEFVKT